MNYKNKRQRLYDKQEGLCYYCKGPMVLVIYPPNCKGGAIRNMCTVEHLIVPVLGESKKGAPLVAACAACNQGMARDYEKQYIMLHKQRSIPKKLRQLTTKIVELIK